MMDFTAREYLADNDTDYRLAQPCERRWLDLDDKADSRYGMYTLTLTGPEISTLLSGRVLEVGVGIGSEYTLLLARKGTP